MRTHRALVIVFGTLVMRAALPAVAADQAKTPTQAYLDCQAAVTKATTLAEVLPHLSAAYRGMLESRPKKDHGVWLERLKDSVNIKDMKINKETIDGDKCTLEATGTSPRGNAVKGKISLVKEGGAWKLDEQFWST